MMPDTKTHQHESPTREHGRDHKKHHRDDHDGGRHGHDNHHRHSQGRRWFNITAEQRDVIVMIVGGIIALTFVLLFIF